ncbi:MAG: glycosyltransferase [Bryobacterales bacterium]|nr:glycosyltransferase [Bryobacterales bacterium]
MLAYTFYDSDNRVRRYAESLVRRGWSVDAIVLRQSSQALHEVIQGVRVFRIQERIVNEGSPFAYLFRLLSFLLRSAVVLGRLHLGKHFDIIHVHSVPNFLVFGTVVVRLFGARVILDIHDVVPELYLTKFNVRRQSPVFRLLLLEEKWSVAYADHVIVANQIWRDRVAARCGCPEKCSVILNYPDPGIFYQRTLRSGDAAWFTMCYPGTLSRHQGVDLIIQAMALLRNVAPDLRLVIIGGGADRERLGALVSEAGLEDRVILKDRLPLESVAEEMANVDLGVEPKRNEDFAGDALSTKISEFMAVGVPVLASDTRVHKFYFSEDVVEFFEAGSSQALAAKIAELKGDSRRRESLRRRAAEFIAENNWDVKKNEYFRIVDSLMKGGRVSAEPVSAANPRSS